MNEWIYLMENPQEKNDHKTTCTYPDTVEYAQVRIGLLIQHI